MSPNGTNACKCGGGGDVEKNPNYTSGVSVPVYGHQEQAHTHYSHTFAYNHSGTDPKNRTNVGRIINKFK